MIHDVLVVCPYCGETYETTIDGSAGSQQYIEDCPVCCQPIELMFEVDEHGQLVNMETHREDE